MIEAVGKILRSVAFATGATWKRIIPVVLITVCLLVVSCAGSEGDAKDGQSLSPVQKILKRLKKEKPPEPERLVNVRVWTSERRTVLPHLETTGSLRADREVVISSEVEGILQAIAVEEGDAVRKGQLLAQIRDTDYRLDLARAEAALRQAEASLANTRSEYARKDALYAEELITRQQYDDVSTRVALAEADLARAQATAAIAQERLARTKIYSPLVGAVKEKKVNVGDYVRNSVPLFAVIKIDPLKLVFTVAEKDIARLKVGQTVTFTVEAAGVQSFQGRLSLLYPHLEERTRTLQVEATVPNSDRALRPGLFARVRIQTGKPYEALVIPATSLLYDGPTIRVFVAEDGIARERIIQTGGRFGEVVEVTEGLSENEQVVVVGQNNLSEGVKLNVAR